MGRCSGGPEFAYGTVVQFFEAQVDSGICQKWRMTFFIFTEFRRTAQSYAVMGFTFLEAAREGSK